MEGKGLSLKPTAKNILAQSVAGLCCYSAFIIAIAVILSKSDNDCENPIREWLIVWIVVGCVSYLILIISNIVALKKPESKCPAFTKVIILLIGLFSISWNIVGSVWLYTADNCEDDNGDMYRLTLAILIMTYIAFGCCCCSIACLFITVCVKAKALKGAGEPPAANQE